MKIQLPRVYDLVLSAFGIREMTAETFVNDI